VGSRPLIWETRATVVQLQCKCRRGFVSKASELGATLLALTANLSMGPAVGGQRVGEKPSAGESPSSIEFESDSVIEVELCVAGFRQWLWLVLVLGIDNFGISASQQRRTG
jgi:hypothetical protein